jgi:hypothetical protein
MRYTVLAGRMLSELLGHTLPRMDHQIGIVHANCQYEKRSNAENRAETNSGKEQKTKSRAACLELYIIYSLSADYQLSVNYD